MALVRRSGLRERKKAALRGHLVDAAMDLFLERGFHGTLVDDIADAATTGQGKTGQFKAEQLGRACFRAGCDRCLQRYKRRVGSETRFSILQCPSKKSLRACETRNCSVLKIIANLRTLLWFEEKF